MINKNIALNLRSGNSKELAQKIENLKESKLNSLSLNSRTNEINTIISNKLINPIYNETKKISSNVDSNSHNLVNLLLPKNNKIKITNNFIIYSNIIY